MVDSEATINEARKAEVVQLEVVVAVDIVITAAPTFIVAIAVQVQEAVLLRNLEDPVLMENAAVTTKTTVPIFVAQISPHLLPRTKVERVHLHG